jgi:hypothetical protein
MLTNFPLNFHKLSQLQRQDPELAEIMDKLDNGDPVDSYILYQGNLFWAKREGGKKLVVPVAAIPMVLRTSMIHR